MKPARSRMRPLNGDKEGSRPSKSYKTGFNFVTQDENVPSLFQPDCLVPIQYFETFRRKLPIEPEKGLFLAVLEDGLNCFQRNLFACDAKRKDLYREAEKWIFAENGGGTFSFENVCETLGLDPGYVRGRLVRWKEIKAAKLSRAKIYRLHPTSSRSHRYAPKTSPLS